MICLPVGYCESHSKALDVTGLAPFFYIHIALSPALYNKCTFKNVEGLFSLCCSLTLFLDYSYNHNRNETNWNLIRKRHTSYYIHPALIYDKA